MANTDFLTLYVGVNGIEHGNYELTSADRNELISFAHTLNPAIKSAVIDTTAKIKSLVSDLDRTGTFTLASGVTGIWHFKEELVCGYPSHYWENDTPNTDPPPMQRYSKEGAAKFDMLVTNLRKPTS